MTRRTRRALRIGLLFTAPWSIGLLAFVLYPVLASLYHSFCDYSVFRTAVWIGFDNYRELLRDEVFWKTIWNTGIFALAAIPLGIVVAVALAMLLNTKSHGMVVYRTIFFIPSLVPMVTLAMLWMWIFNGSYGILNYGLNGVLRLLHLPFEAPGWLLDPHWAKPALVLMGMWGCGNAIVIFLAGLQDIPVSLYEAAEIDGASRWQKTIHVTLPMLSPVIYFNVIMGIIGTFQVFAVPYIMTGGGPQRATLFYAMYIFQTAFEDLRMGYASAQAVILFLIILACTYLATRVMRKHVHYGGV
ncbi:MAG: sugar ABC transporter permease [bacterium]|nr:sugar ABC transporter permease [bacterium]